MSSLQSLQTKHIKLTKNYENLGIKEKEPENPFFLMSRAHTLLK
jgi:hypothetical protein